MSDDEKNVATDVPAKAADWICQRELAAVFGISARTASIRAQAGLFRQFEHGVPGCGVRKYSRQLVERLIKRRLEEAIERQDSLPGEGTVSS